MLANVGGKVKLCLPLFFSLFLLFTGAARSQQLLVPVTDTLPRSDQQSQSKKEDEPDLIEPARPGVSNPAEFQRPGVLQLEYGYDGSFRARDSST